MTADALLPEPPLASPSNDVASPWGSPQQRAKQRRNKYDALLATAAAVFKQQGFAAASLDQVAAQLGITKPTLYYYVPSKAQLVHSCALQGFAQALAGVQRAKALLPALKAYAQVVASDCGWCMVRAEEYALPLALAQVQRQQRKAVEQALRSWLPAGMQAAVLLRAVEGVALHLPLTQLHGLLACLPTVQPATDEMVGSAVMEGPETVATVDPAEPLLRPALAPTLEAVPMASVLPEPVVAEPPALERAAPAMSQAFTAQARRKPRKMLEQISLF